MRVCILSLSSYNVLARDTAVQHIGGGEVQIVAIGRGLGRLGVPVSFVTHDHGQSDGVRMEGVTVHRTFRPDAGLPGLRFFHRWSSVSRALSRANADAYVQAGADSWTGLAAFWCRWHDRSFVFVSMSEGDCRPDLPFLKTRRDRALYRYGLRHADAVVVQTEIQRRMMCENFGMEGVVIRPCCSTPEHGAVAGIGSPQREIVWVGRFSPEKRLEWFLDIAEALPDVTCHAVGQANMDVPYSRRLVSRAKGMSNVVLHGFVPHERMGEIYRRSGLLVSTSQIEGFPTVFMEAWARGIPTVATVDPDHLIERYGLGATARDVSSLVAASRFLLDDPLHWRRCSDNARQHFANHHTIEAAAIAFSKLLAQVSVVGDDKRLDAPHETSTSQRI